MKVTFLAALAVGFALLFGGTAMAHRRRRLHPDELAGGQRRAPPRSRI